MEEISLYTRTGEFVVKVVIPRFTPKAEVLVWGDRHFVYNSSTGLYMEGMAFYIPPKELLIPKIIEAVNKRRERIRGQQDV